MPVTVSISATAETPEEAFAQLRKAPTTPPITAPTGLAALIAATPANGTLTLPAGVLRDTAALPNPIFLTGVGRGQTIIDCIGKRPTNDKSVLVVQASGCVISDMTLQNAAIAPGLGNNAAGVRDSGPNVGFTLRNVEVTGCQDGVLTFASNILIDQCLIHDNGAGDTRTHEIYVDGSPGTKMTITGSTVTCGSGASHALKSRAGTTAVARCKLTGAPSGGGSNGGSVIDIPNGGLVTIEDTDVTLSPGASNHMFIGYGMEPTMMLNAAVGKTVALTGVRLHGNGVAGSIETKIPGAILVIGAGCTFDGTVPPALIGWAAGSISGAFRPA